MLQTYAQHSIKLSLTPKRVKNINFRIKLIKQENQETSQFISELHVSYPYNLSKNLLEKTLAERLNWAIDCQSQQLKTLKNRAKSPNLTKPSYVNKLTQMTHLTLQSEIYFLGEKVIVNDLFSQNFGEKDFSKTDIAKTIVSIYNHWLNHFIQNRQDFWQNQVGKSATKISPYTMKTRWGSCSTHAKTIRLSIWLAQFPPSCADYVMVHELCHLYEANHSAKFWAWVQKVMPDYKIWHNQLKNALGDAV